MVTLISNANIIAVTVCHHVVQSAEIGREYYESNQNGYEAMLEAHEEIPCLFCHPVHIRSGILHVFGMTAHKGTKQYRIFFGKTFKLCGDMGGCGGYRNLRQLCQSVVFEVCQYAVLAPLFELIGIDKLAETVFRTCGAIEGKRLFFVFGKIDVPVGRSISGNST